MKKETIYKDTTLDVVDVTTRLKSQFPEFFDKQGNFIQSSLDDALSNSGVELLKESYCIDWLGKSYARLMAHISPKTLLVDDLEHNSADENKNSKHLLLKGDNLEILKHLIHCYEDEVDMIYIDPPYNTGKDDFSYSDDRQFSAEQLSSLTGTEIEEAKKILNFTTSKSNSHSAWLTFIYPRLYVAKQFLKPEGVIFISIDDNELAQLRMICNAIFGEQNHIGTIVWKNVTDNNPSNVAIEHEYIVVYARDKAQLANEWKSKVSDVKDILVKVGNDLTSQYEDPAELREAYSQWYKAHKSELWPLENYKFIDHSGVYSGERGIHNPGKEGYRYDIMHPETHKPCKQPLMGYRFPEDTMKKMVADGRIIFGKDENKLVEIKVYAHEYRQKLSSVFNLDGRSGSNELKAIFPEVKKAFTNPKATQLLEELIAFACTDNAIIMDFFAGSGTTANAVLKLNHNQKTNHRFIAVQLDEPTKTQSELRKAGYETIFDLTKERISRNCKSLGGEGFKVFETIPDFRKCATEELSFSNYSFFDDEYLTDEQYRSILTTWNTFDGARPTDALTDIQLDSYVAHLSDNRLYMIAPDFTTNSLKELFLKLDNDPDFSPSKIIFYGNNFDSSKQMEINEAVKNYSNKKSIEIDVVVRY